MLYSNAKSQNASQYGLVLRWIEWRLEFFKRISRWTSCYWAISALTNNTICMFDHCG